MPTPNEILKRWFDEVWNEGRQASIQELLAADAVVLGLPGGPIEGPAAFAAFHSQFSSVFHELDFLINEAMEWGDEAMARVNLIMTHRASGHRAALEGACWIRCRNGQILEARNYINFLELLQQLSLAPKDYFQQRASAPPGSS